MSGLSRLGSLSVGTSLIVLLSIAAWTDPAASETVAFESSAPSAATETVPHRLLWSFNKQDGYEVWSAGINGEQKVRLANASRGEVWNVSLSKDGQRAAFAPDVGRTRAKLLVTRTAGGPVKNVLADQRRFEGIGPIAWSPDGNSLAFAGYIDAPTTGLFFPSYLWTIRRDGTHLRRRILLDGGRNNGEVFGELGWTRRGIIYIGHGNIRVLRGTRSTLLLKRASQMYMSGNGRWIIFRRYNRLQDPAVVLWRIHPGGTGLERLINMPYLGPEDPPFGWAPNYDGSLLIGTRRNQTLQRLETITFRPHEPHDIQILATTGRALLVDWN